MLIRMLGRYAQGAAVDWHERKQRLAHKQGALSFQFLEVNLMIFTTSCLTNVIVSEAKLQRSGRSLRAQAFNLGSIFD